VKGSVLLREGFDYSSIGVWGFGLYPDLIIGEGFDHVLLRGYMIKKIK
jgi:hypothetical protein